MDQGPSWPRGSNLSATGSRLLALELLNRVSIENAYANLLMPKLIAQAKLESRDSNFAQELGFGTIRWQLTYDTIIDSVSSRGVSDIDIVLLNCLRLGTHQILQMRVPNHAALSETVELVRNKCGEKVVGFANGVLRRVSERSFDEWLELICRGKTRNEVLSLRYSHPEWIVAALNQSLAVDGMKDEIENLLAINNIPPAVNLVALPGMQDIETPRTEDNANQFSPYGFSIENGNPAELNGFGDGIIRVQDEGSQLAALALASFGKVQSEEKWLDMCAGPGGKAALLAQISSQLGAEFTANEILEHRADLVAATLSKLGTFHLTQMDGRLIGEESPDVFDRILIDAPCSGLGALRRRPEARWRKQPSDLKELTQLQLQLVESGLKALKPGGYLLYVTCSPHLSETTAIVDKAQKQLGAQVLDLTSHMNAAFMKNGLPIGRKTVQLHTQRDNTDSMFMALLTK